jgi:hypothetical protein
MFEHQNSQIRRTSTAVDIDDAVRSCRRAGKKGNFNEVIATADSALRSMIPRIENQEGSILKRQKLQIASLDGYKGFALLKMGKYAEALSHLETSQARRTRLLKGNLERNATKGQECSLHQREAQVVEHALGECYRLLGQSPTLPSLIKYPRTTHLFDSGGTSTTVDDLILPDLSHILPLLCDGHANVIVEEKVDGANLGISMCPVTHKLLVQNRSHYISGQGDHAQFHRIPEWVEEHRQTLTQILQGGNRILYGEWVVARHSIPYQRLPGMFVAFDILDKQRGRFFSRRRFHSLMQDSRIPVAPVIQAKAFGPYSNRNQAQKEVRRELLRLLETTSSFRNDGGTVEGIVLRVDDDNDDDDDSWLQEKFKVVRPDFIRGCGDGHWSARQIEKQVVDCEFAEEYLHSCFRFGTGH